jgi:hypothetical protein
VSYGDRSLGLPIDTKKQEFVNLQELAEDPYNILLFCVNGKYKMYDTTEQA